jgi:hypothetical protein
MLQARRIVLVLAALVFAVIAVASLAWPHAMAAQLGYRLDNIDALNEYRAIYVGLWLATAVLLATAAVRIRELILGDLGALLILGQTFGRCLSVLLDGVPSERIWPVFGIELVGGVALLLLRPRAHQSTTARSASEPKP